MRLLLDTHIAIWAIMGDERLKSATADIIRDPDNDVFVSMASIWELTIKFGLSPRRPSAIALSPAAALEEFTAASFALMDIRVAHILATVNLTPHHGDPFDRLLVAQANSERCQLVTADRILAAYGDHVMLV